MFRENRTMLGSVAVAIEAYEDVLVVVGQPRHRDVHVAIHSFDRSVMLLMMLFTSDVQARPIISETLSPSTTTTSRIEAQSIRRRSRSCRTARTLSRGTTVTFFRFIIIY